VTDLSSRWGQYRFRAAGGGGKPDPEFNRLAGCHLLGRSRARRFRVAEVALGTHRVLCAPGSPRQRFGLTPAPVVDLRPMALRLIHGDFGLERGPLLGAPLAGGAQPARDRAYGTPPKA
jgi:hypothetical protein